jgi:hypothetical protein
LRSRKPGIAAPITSTTFWIVSRGRALFLDISGLGGRDDPVPDERRHRQRRDQHADHHKHSTAVAATVVPTTAAAPPCTASANRGPPATTTVNTGRDDDDQQDAPVHRVGPCAAPQPEHDQWNQREHTRQADVRRVLVSA